MTQDGGKWRLASCGIYLEIGFTPRSRMSLDTGLEDRTHGELAEASYPDGYPLEMVVADLLAVVDTMREERDEARSELGVLRSERDALQAQNSLLRSRETR